MRHTPIYVVEDPAEVKRMIRRNAWATFVSPTSKGLVASHYPVILDPTSDGDEIVIVSHFGRPDERSHELGEHEVLVIIQGPHDYVSASWYPEGQVVSTWDHVTAHLYGTPEVLSDEENYRMLEALTDHFERHYEGGRSLSEDPEGTRRMAKGTVGLRMKVDRFDARLKLSQNKPEPVFERVKNEFEKTNPPLAREMDRVEPRPERD